MRSYEEISAELALWREKRAKCDLVTASVGNKVFKTQAALAKANAELAELKERTCYYFHGVSKAQLKNAEAKVAKAEKKLAAAREEREKVAKVSKRISTKFKELKQLLRKADKSVGKREFEAEQKALKKAVLEELIARRAAARASRITKKEAARRQAALNREAREAAKFAKAEERLAKREARAERARLNREAREAKKAAREAELAAARAERERKRAQERAEREAERLAKKEALQEQARISALLAKGTPKDFYEAQREIRVLARTSGRYSEIFKLVELKKTQLWKNDVAATKVRLLNKLIWQLKEAR